MVHKIEKWKQRHLNFFFMWDEKKMFFYYTDV